MKNTGSTPALGVQPRSLTASRNIVEPIGEPALTPVELPGGGGETASFTAGTGTGPVVRLFRLLE